MAVTYPSTSSDHTVLANQNCCELLPMAVFTSKILLAREPSILQRFARGALRLLLFDVLSTLLDDFSAEELAHCIEARMALSGTLRLSRLFLLSEDWPAQALQRRLSKDVALQITPPPDECCSGREVTQAAQCRRQEHHDL